MITILLVNSCVILLLPMLAVANPTMNRSAWLPAGSGKSRSSNTILQRTLFCPCGRDLPAVAGLCRRCYLAAWRSERFFGGNREEVLARDRGCRACGSRQGLCVHHRAPGRQDLPLLIAVCRVCHVRLHRRHLLPGGAPPLLVELWEEQHSGWPLQLSFFWTAGRAA
jgi:hypothetical protein